MKEIKDYQENMTGESFALIENVTIKEDKRGAKFISLILVDKTGQIEAKIWNASEEDIKQFVTNRVVYFEGRKELYQGRVQMRLLKIRLATQEEPNNPKLYQKNIVINLDEAKNEINKYLGKIKEPVWQKVVEHLLTKYEDQFYCYPAAKFHHHAFKHGLVNHTLGMLKLAEQIGKLYQNLNSELLYAGIILHDLGKVLELSGFEDTYYTLEGNLCGHIALIDEEVALAADKLKIEQNDKKLVLLKHMVLAHHGKLEYGSPVVPRIAEAEILNHIDMLDATMQMLDNALMQTQSGEYTMPIAGLDKRQFYKV